MKLRFSKFIVISACMLQGASMRAAAQVEISVRPTPHISIVGGPGQIAIEQAATLDERTKWTAVTNYLWSFGGQLAFINTDLPETGQRYYRISRLNLTKMIWISPGQFQMGSATQDPCHQDDESPMTDVNISQGFWIGKYEVTQGEYCSVPR